MAEHGSTNAKHIEAVLASKANELVTSEMWKPRAISRDKHLRLAPQNTRLGRGSFDILGWVSKHPVVDCQL